ncbi:MAG: ABC transporter permease [Rhodospirillales bacterium]
MSGSEVTSAARMALATILEHKMRSFLTVLGVIIGTGTVIAVSSLVTGVDAAVANVMASLGPDTAMVFKFNIGFRGAMTPEEWKRKPLTWENAQAIKERCPSVVHVSPYLFSPNTFSGRSQDRVRYKGEEVYRIQLAGTDESYGAGGTEKILYGRFFTDDESRRRRPVVVIGEDVQKGLFPYGDPVGKWIDVNGQYFEVIGVMARPAASPPGHEDLRVLLPYFTMRKMFPQAKENMIIVVARKGKIILALDEVRTVLRQERRVPYNKPDDFWMSTGQQMLEDFRRITSTVAVVMVVLSSIGLLVGGIGVMNIMLVSVTERTREIGIRKAIGAKKTDIVAQFLTEAVVLTGLGGLLGMSLGWMISAVARVVFPMLPTAVPLWAAATGVLVSVGVGLFFGIWPAAKAARLDPVVALRYE